MGSLRLYHRIGQSLSISESFDQQNTKDVHFVPQIMYEVAQFLYPSVFINNETINILSFFYIFWTIYGKINLTVFALIFYYSHGLFTFIYPIIKSYW
jgi:hypothetical protein